MARNRAGEGDCLAMDGAGVDLEVKGACQLLELAHASHFVAPEWVENGVRSGLDTDLKLH